MAAATDRSRPMSDIPRVKLGRLREGAKPIGKSKGVNDTYFGAIYTDEAEYPAYVKDLDLTQLVNELVAATIGGAMALPVPDPHLVATPSTAGMTKGPKLTDGSGRVAFAVPDRKLPPVRQFLQCAEAIPGNAIRKWKYLKHAVYFDEWIANRDRHDRNLLFDGESQFILIDHGHAFTGPSWEPGDLQPTAKVANQLIDGWPKKFYTEGDINKIASGAKQAAKNCSLLNIEYIMNASFASFLLDSVNATAFKDFLVKRLPLVEDFIRERLGEARLL